MAEVRKENNQAGQLYRKALQLDPITAVMTANFSLFMLKVRKNFDEAERLYRKTLELDPKEAAWLVRQRSPREALAPMLVGRSMMEIGDVTAFRMPADKKEQEITIRQLI